MGTTLGRYILMSASIAVLVAAVLAWPYQAWIGDAWLPTLALAGGICLIGAVIGHVVGRLAAGLYPAPDEGPKAVQVAMTARLLLTLALTLPAILMKWVPGMAFVVALGIQYLAQLALEVFVAVRELRQNHGPTGTPARHSQPEDDLPSGSNREGAVDDGTGAKVR